MNTEKAININSIAEINNINFNIFIINFIYSSNLMNYHYKYKSENHKSLISNIIFQIKNNKKVEYQRKINSYLYNNLLNKSDFIYSNFREFEIIIKLKKALEDKNNSNFPKKDINSFIEDLELLLSVLNKKYINLCFDKIDKILKNKRIISSKEIERLIYYSKLIISDYHEKGLIEDIIRFEYYGSQKNIKVENFNDFKKYLYNLRESKEFVFIINSSLEIKNNFEIKIENVKFQNNIPDKIDEMQLTSILPNNKLTNKDFFAIVKLEFDSMNYLQIARYNIQSKLRIFEKIILQNDKKNISKLFFNINNLGYIKIGNYQRVNISSHKIEIEKEDFYDYILDLNSSKDLTFLERNEFFINGYFSDDINLKLLYLWNFLDSYEITDKILKKCLDKDVLNFLYENFKQSILKIKCDFINHLCMFRFKTESNHINQINRFIYNDEYENCIEYFIENFNFPYLKDELKSDFNIREFENFIFNIFKEIYNQRNMIVHGCTFNNNSIVNNIDIFVYITNLIRIYYFEQELN